MATICSASTTVVVVKSEDLELFSVERQLISTNRKVNLQLGNDSLVATKAMSYRAITNKKLIN
jgi:DNA-directed RNA polymerase-5 subunit 1